jgi:hypothetical protein
MFNSPDFSEPAESITNVAFKKDRIVISVGSSDYINITVAPAILQNVTSFEWDYDGAVISINPDSYGVVVTGLQAGSTYLKATANGITSTCLVEVQGVDGEYTGIPYIYSNTTVVQLNPGNMDTITASLYGGQSYDLEDFSWSVSDSSVADISYTRNNCVVYASKTGTAKITATHPKAPYPYTFIVYCYTDELTECYLTTANNIVTIHKQALSTQNVSVSVVNPYSSVHQSGFRWQVIADGSPCVSVSANGETAVLTGTKDGMALVRITYDEAAWPLDILVRVTTAVQNVYVVPSVTTVEVTGSTNVYNVTARVEGYSGFVNPAAFVWDVPSGASSLMTWQAVDNTLSITGKLNGTVKVRVSHELSEYSRSILIILREQAGSAIDSSMYITTSSNYVQTQVGAARSTVNITISGGVPGDENNLIWTIDNGVNNNICLIETTTGRIESRAAGSFTNGAVHITPKNPGTAHVTISHPKILYQTEILIKVYSQYAQLVEPAVITSDQNIVRILNGQTAEITVNLTGNYQPGDENAIQWISDNSGAVSVSPSSGKTVVLSAAGSGSHQTYVSASHSKAQSQKKILVLTADTQTELDAMKGIYSDQTYYRINVNGTAQLSLNQFGLSSTDIASIQWTVNTPAAASVQKNASNGLEAVVTGHQSGQVTVTATSVSGTEPCRFVIVILPEGESTGTIVPKYLTTQKNAVVLSGPGQQAQLSVSGVNLTEAEMTSTSWMTDNPLVASVSGSAGNAAVTANAIGQTKIHASNLNSTNSIAIDVKVGALYEWDDSLAVYISTENDVVAIVKGEKKTIGATLVNSTQTDGFSFLRTGSPIIDISGTYAGTCLIEAQEAGVSEITVMNSAAVASKEILVVVANTREELEGFKYLTTTQNLVTVGESLNVSVSVSIRNESSPVLSGYHWTSSDPSVVQVVSSGSMAVFYGKKTGTVKVSVTNDLCAYPLEIIANCVDPIAAANNPYIMSPNIVTLTVGAANTTLKAELIGGKPSDNTGFSWQLADTSLASLYASNETAQIKATKEGVTQIVIRHPKANGIDRTVLVICEPKRAEDCYITTAESIIRMSPSASPKTVTATLINGSANDAYNFKWWADSYDVIELNYTGASAVITPIAAGTTTIHISHPKAAYQKDIILYISQYSEFKFDRTSLSIEAGKQIGRAHV